VTLIAGFIIGALRIGLELAKDALEVGSIWHTLGSTNFLTFAAWFFLFCVMLILVVSWLTPAPAPEKVANLTFGTLSPAAKAQNKNSYNWKDITISIVIIAIVIGIMIWFNGK
jgi:SSS family solute:Na+ symporter